MSGTVRQPKLPVHEVFGPTIQGEGMVIGRKTMFIRTGGCDYSCAWCDSSFTWDGSAKPTLMTPVQIWERLLQASGYKYDGVYNFNHVTISGGNPALFNAPIDQLIDILKEHEIQVGLETQGSRWQDWFSKVDDLTISPKPPSSGMETNWDVLDEIIDRLAFDAPCVCTEYSLKVVIFDELDFEYAKKVYQRYVVERRSAYASDFYVSVGNADAKEDGDISGRLLNKLEWLWDKVIADPECNNWKPLPQLHTLVWANKRGV